MSSPAIPHRKRPGTSSRGARIALAVLSTLVLIVPLSLTAQEREHIGYVLDVEGDWFLAGRPQRPLTRAERVPAGGKIYIRNPSQYDRIYIASRSNDILDCRNCKEPDARCASPCNSRMELPKSGKAGASAFDVAFDTFIGFWWRKQRNPGGGVRDGELQEAVVRSSGEVIDLAPVFRTAPAQKEKFCARLRPVPRQDEPWRNDWLGPVQVEGAGWDTPTVSIPGISPGLYEVELRHDVRGECKDVEGSSWVLVTKPEEYERVLSSFRQAVEVTKKWGDGPRPGPEVKRSFLQTYLDYLARR